MNYWFEKKTCFYSRFVGLPPHSPAIQRDLSRTIIICRGETKSILMKGNWNIEQACNFYCSPKVQRKSD